MIKTNFNILNLCNEYLKYNILYVLLFLVRVITFPLYIPLNYRIHYNIIAAKYNNNTNLRVLFCTVSLFRVLIFDPIFETLNFILNFIGNIFCIDIISRNIRLAKSDNSYTQGNGIENDGVGYVSFDLPYYRMANHLLLSSVKKRLYIGHATSHNGCFLLGKGGLLYSERFIVYIANSNNLLINNHDPLLYIETIIEISSTEPEPKAMITSHISMNDAISIQGTQSSFICIDNPIVSHNGIQLRSQEDVTHFAYILNEICDHYYLSNDDSKKCDLGVFRVGVLNILSSVLNTTVSKLESDASLNSAIALSYLGIVSGQSHENTLITQAKSASFNNEYYLTIKNIIK